MGKTLTWFFFDAIIIGKEVKIWQYFLLGGMLARGSMLPESLKKSSFFLLLE